MLSGSSYGATASSTTRLPSHHRQRCRLGSVDLAHIRQTSSVVLEVRRRSTTWVEGLSRLLKRTSEWCSSTTGSVTREVPLRTYTGPGRRHRHHGRARSPRAPGRACKRPASEHAREWCGQCQPAAVDGARRPRNQERSHWRVACTPRACSTARTGRSAPVGRCSNAGVATFGIRARGARALTWQPRGSG